MGVDYGFIVLKYNAEAGILVCLILNLLAFD